MLLRRHNARGGAVYKRGELIPRRRVPTEGDIGGGGFYDSAVLYHLKTADAVVSDSGLLEYFPNPGKAGGIVQGNGDIVSLPSGYWKATLGPIIFPERLDLGRVHVLMPIIRWAGQTRPGVVMGWGTASPIHWLNLSYSGDGLRAGPQAHVDAVQTTGGRSTLPANDEPGLFEWWAVGDPLTIRQRNTNLGQATVSVWSNFYFDHLGGDAAGVAMNGSCGDVVILDQTAPDYADALAVARSTLRAQYGIQDLRGALDDIGGLLDGS